MGGADSRVRGKAAAVLGDYEVSARTVGPSVVVASR